METRLHVSLMTHTLIPESVVAAAARMCYSNDDAVTLMANLTPQKIESFIKKLQSMGHESPFEHVSFTFAIEGVSRTLTHQLVRHRIASYSQRSQRYVSEAEADYILPPSIAANPAAKKCFQKIMQDINRAYNDLATHYSIPKEDARYVLANATETKIVATLNARSLFNFFHHRCCNRAQWEIRALATEMLWLVREVAPNIFRYAGPSCLSGSCPEGEMSCGKAQQMRDTFAFRYE